MRTPPYFHYEGASNYRRVTISPGVCLHFSYTTLVAIEIEDTNFVSESYVRYSRTTQRHIGRLRNRVVISKQLFQETLEICIPEPPPQTRDWLLERSKKERIGTPS